jgi:hypothetical protein
MKISQFVAKVEHLTKSLLSKLINILEEFKQVERPVDLVKENNVDIPVSIDQIFKAKDEYLDRSKSIVERLKTFKDDPTVDIYKNDIIKWGASNAREYGGNIIRILSLNLDVESLDIHLAILHPRLCIKSTFDELLKTIQEFKPEWDHNSCSELVKLIEVIEQ